MRNLMTFGIVLVVLAMVTSTAFGNRYEGPSPGTWCNDGNWSGDIPTCDDPDGKAEIRGDDVLCSNAACAIAAADSLQIRTGSLTVGKEGVHVDLTICGELEMADDKSGDYAVLDIVNGDVFVEGQSKDVGEDGDIHIIVAAGSSLTFDDGMYFGDSNGDESVYIVDIAGDYSVQDDRIEQRGGDLTMNLTGNATVDVEKTTRYSSDNDSVATINITDDAVYDTDKVELGEKDDGADFDYSLAINISGNGTWNGSGEDLKDQDKGQIFNLNVTDNGTFIGKKLDINDDDSVINITMDSGLIDIEDDMDMEQGTISITGGEFNVGDDFELGDEGVASMLVAGTADVTINHLIMGDDAELTVDGVRVDLDTLEMESSSSIEINGAGELVIKDADDPEDWDDIADLIDDGQIMTSEAGMVVIWDYDVTNDGAVTVRIAIPVGVDFQPGSCENPLRVNFISRGVYPVAITGSDDFDVLDVDVETITLEGVAVIRGAVEDVSNADDVCDLGPDGIPDLITKFSRTELLDALEAAHGDLGELPNRAELRLNLIARTVDGTLISGSDSLLILNQGTIVRSRR